MLNATVTYDPFDIPGALPDLLPFIIYLISLSYLTYEVLETRRRHLAPHSYWDITKESFLAMFAVKVAIKLWIVLTFLLNLAFSCINDYFEGVQVEAKYGKFLNSHAILNTLLVVISTTFALVPLWLARNIHYRRVRRENIHDFRAIIYNFGSYGGELGSAAYYLERPPPTLEEESTERGVQTSRSATYLRNQGFRSRIRRTSV